MKIKIITFLMVVFTTINLYAGGYGGGKQNYIWLIAFIVLLFLNVAILTFFLKNKFFDEKYIDNNTPDENDNTMNINCKESLDNLKISLNKFSEYLDIDYNNNKITLKKGVIFSKENTDINSNEGSLDNDKIIDDLDVSNTLEVGNSIELNKQSLEERFIELQKADEIQPEIVTNNVSLDSVKPAELSNKNSINPNKPIIEEKIDTNIKQKLYVSKFNINGYFENNLLNPYPNDDSYYIIEIEKNKGKIFFNNNKFTLQKALYSPENYIKPFCENQNAFNQNALKIVTVVPGTIIKEGNLWKVQSKAEIKYE